MSLFGPPDIEKLIAKRDIKGLIKSLGYKDDEVRLDAAKAMGELKDSRFVQPLVDALKDSSGRVRQIAVEALGKIGDMQAVEPLRAALYDRDKYVHSAAAMALGQMGDAQAIKPLVDVLMDCAPDMRARVVDTLLVFGKRAVPALIAALPYSSVREVAPAIFGRLEYGYTFQHLSDALNDPNPEIREAVCEVISEVGNPRDVIELLVATLADKDAAVRYAASDTLKKFGWQPANDAERSAYAIARQNWEEVRELGTAAVKLLIPLLSDYSEDMRAAVASTLGDIGDRRAVKPLIDGLHERGRALRKAAVEALGKIGDPLATGPLNQILKDNDAIVREAALRALARLGDTQAVQKFTSAVDEKNADVRRAAVQALQQSSGGHDVESFIEKLVDEDNTVRATAIEALIQLKDTAVQPLITRLTDPRSRMRKEAASVLSRLGWQPADDRQKVYLAIAQGRWKEVGAFGIAAVEPLLAMLDDNNADEIIHNRAAKALQQAADEQAIKPLSVALKHSKTRVRRAAIHALGHIGVEAVFPLIKALKHGRTDVRLAAISALGEIRDMRALEPLITALTHRVADIRLVAATALGQLGDARATKPLIDAINKEDLHEENRCRLIRILGDVGDTQAIKPLLNWIKPMCTLDWPKDIIGHWEYQCYAACRDALDKLIRRLSDKIHTNQLYKLANHPGGSGRFPHPKADDPEWVAGISDVMRTDWVVDFSSIRKLASEELIQRGFKV